MLDNLQHESGGLSGGNRGVVGSLRAGQFLKHYRVIDKIGQGGMGRIYKAEDTKLGRRVAIKLLPEEAMRDAKAKLRLLREARSASALNHPSIVTIHAIDDAEGLDFIVMEYVEGETLSAAIGRGGALALPRLLDIVEQVADALAAAHSSGIIHRDIKSENILLTTRGQAKVLDFGIAKQVPTISGEIDTEAPTRTHLTGANIIIGTVPYMSPEQTRGEVLDARSDIFSLGCVLYEAATGRLPFGGPSVLSITHEIATVDPPPPSAFRLDLPREFDVIVELALAKDKERRYQSAAELAAALRSLKGAAAQPQNFDGGMSGKPASGTTESESFVGREAELAKLDELLRKAISGSGSVVFITGEPGIGKTAFVERFLHHARKSYSGLLAARGRCVEQYGTGEAYLPFLDAIGALLAGPGRERTVAFLRTYAPTWCLQFPAALISTAAMESLQQETGGVSKDRMLREMGDALRALTANTPTILLLEDLHWADPSSVDLLRHLCQRAADLRLLIVGTFRPDDVELSDHPLKSYMVEMRAHNSCEEIALGALDAEHVARYLDARFSPHNFPAELSALIGRKTEGHPLFATSLVDFLAGSGGIVKSGDGRWSLARPLSEMDVEAPESVRSMIRKKLEALSEEDRLALQYASVEGEEFLSTTVAHLLDTDDLALEERLAVVERMHHLIVARGEEELPDGTLATRYRFAHALYQNVLYGDLISKRRIQLHRKAGEQLARHYGARSTRIAAQLAMHFERGRDFGRAVEHLTHAGGNAAKLYANAEAAEYYGRALGLVAKLADEEQEKIRLELYQKRGAAHLALGRFQLAVDDYTEMLDAARRLGSPIEESAALNALAMTLFYSHRLDEITSRVDEVLRAAERAGSEALRVEALQVIALKHLGYGELEQARPMLDEIIDSARRLAHKRVLLTGLAWRGILHFFQTEYTLAEEMLTEAQSLARELRDGFLLLESYFVLGMVRGNQGRMSEALTTFDEGLEIAQRYGDQFWSPRMPNCIGWIYRELQDFDRALEYNQQGLEVGREAQVLEAQANSLINLGIDYRHAGENAKTLAAFNEVENIFKRDAWFRWRYQIRLQAGACEHWLAQGNLDKAEQKAHRLLETATHYQARKYIAVAHNLLAKIATARGDLATTKTETEAAANQLNAYPVPIVAWKTYAALGRVRQQAGDISGAGAAFTQAAMIVKGIAAGVSDEKLRSTFLNSTTVQKVLERAGE